MAQPPGLEPNSNRNPLPSGFSLDKLWQYLGLSAISEYLKAAIAVSALICVSATVAVTTGHAPSFYLLLSWGLMAALYVHGVRTTLRASKPAARRKKS